MKTCNTCHQTKPFDEFYPNSQCKYGYTARCRMCLLTQIGERTSQKTGKPYRPRTRTLAERFWHNVDQSGGPDACWPWTAGRHNQGYGYAWLGGGSRKQVSAHRLAFELTYGPIPAGLFVLHQCHFPPCCNPEHLKLGTQQDNVDDRMLAGRHTTLHGSLNGHSKLTDANVRAIRSLAGNLMLKDIAEQFSVSIGTIWNIIHRRTWKHLD